VFYIAGVGVSFGAIEGIKISLILGSVNACEL
jgi:hypothetical protein